MKHVNILRWDEISKSIQLGGMGMKKLDDMDKACLLKVGWKIKTQDNSLWRQVMKRKYDINTNLDIKVKDKVYESSLWNIIISIWPL